METIDETLLNDDNDEDLDYDLDPKEENALLQEEADFLVQEYEDEDVLDINVDYDQMDVSDDKLDSASSDKSKRDGETIVNRRNAQIYNNGKSDKFKNNYRIHKGGSFNSIRNRVMKRSKTVLLNPRFKGPLNVNGRQLAWETPSPVLNEVQKNHHYIQPWISGNVPNQAFQQNHIAVNNYNPPQFVPNNSYMYMNQQQPVLQSQPFAQPQVFINPPPMMDQALFSNQNMMPQQPTLQIGHGINNYQNPPMSQTEQIQQVSEAQKLPVHQRLGVPMSNFNTSNNQMCYDNNQPFQSPIPFENHQFNQFSQTIFNTNEQFVDMNQPSMDNNQFLNKKFDNYSNFNRKQHRKFTGNQNVNNSVGNNRVVLPRKADVYNQKLFLSKNSQPSDHSQKLKVENSSSSNILVVPDDEDEETRQYRIKIEEQKRKREEVLRKKEENRLKNLSDVPDTSTPPLVHKVVSHPARPLHQKKFNYQHRSQHYPFVKTQVNTNNIVITGNDDQCHFNSRHNKKKGSYNKGGKNLAMRVVTAEPLFTTNINSKIEPFDKEVDPNSLSSFLSNRTVSTQENLMQTKIVVIKNLATATTEPKLMKLCGGIGTVQVRNLFRLYS